MIERIWRWLAHVSLAVWLWAVGLGAIVTAAIAAALFYWALLPVGLRIVLSAGLFACSVALFLDAVPQAKRMIQEKSRIEAPEERVAWKLAEKSYRVAGQAIPGDRFFLDRAIWFRDAHSEQSLKMRLILQARDNFRPDPKKNLGNSDLEWMFDREPGLVARQVLDDWCTLRLLNGVRETTPGAQPSPTGTYSSYQAMPKSYTVYTLSDTGYAELQYLKQLVILPSVRKAMSQQKPVS